MITFLKIAFGFILVFMTYMAIATSLESNLFEEWNFLAGIPWMRATLWDFYFNIFAIYLWICYKERNWLLRITWLILLVTLGSIGVSLYVLIALYRLPKGASVKDLLLQKQ